MSSIPISELTVIDYEILRYINKPTSVSKSQINNHFLNKYGSVDYRLSQLTRQDYIKMRNSQLAVPGSSYIEENCEYIESEGGVSNRISLNSYRITGLGIKVLQDYQQKNKYENKLLWRANVWIPVTVATATVLTIDGLQWLLPQILKWFSDFLDRMF